jgi:hypothetical protein
MELYAITTKEKVSDYLNLGLPDADKDAWIEKQIDYVSGFVETYCKRKFKIQDVSGEILNGNGRSKIRPYFYPIVQLSVADSPTDAQKLASVQYRESVSESWTDIETDVNNILINTPPLHLLTNQTHHTIELVELVFPEGTQNIKLSYRAGLSGQELDEIEMLVIEMVAMRYKESAIGNNILGVSSINQGGGGASYNTIYKNMKSEWKEVLDRYKRRF